MLETNVDFQYNNTGSTVIDGRTITDSSNSAQGNIGLEEAIVYSSNAYFADKAVEIGDDKLREVANKYMLDKKIPFDLETSTSSFSKGTLSQTATAEAGIGQGEVLTTPLNMALMASTIANNGDMVNPYMVDSIKDSEGRLVSQTRPEVLSNVMSPSMAGQLTDMMTG